MENSVATDSKHENRDHVTGGRRLKRSKDRLAIVVSHPIQYYAPLYRRLARRDDVAIRVFFTWHAGGAAVEDRGFGMPVAWDIPLTVDYDLELVPNVASDPGTHHFFGLNNPTLVERVVAWQPNVVHVTGWAWLSHLWALRAFRRKGIPTLFRGDSHLLDGIPSLPRWWTKRVALKRVFSWPTGFLVVGAANRAYYQAFGVRPDRLFACPHSIDVGRFAQPAEMLEREAAGWRDQLGIAEDRCVLLFAGKFERKKRPLELMHAVRALPDPGPVLLMVGSGELEAEVHALAAANPERFRVLPFQNQSRMAVVYRLGDLCVLPSAFGETWGLAVNEALACSRPVLVSDRVGCAQDVVDESCGRIFSSSDPLALPRVLKELTENRGCLLQMRQAAARRAWSFDIACTEEALLASVRRTSAP
jgi:glycosyltransferase involved in cell wall biosynthesis